MEDEKMQKRQKMAKMATECPCGDREPFKSCPELWERLQYHFSECLRDSASSCFQVKADTSSLLPLSTPFAPSLFPLEIWHHILSHLEDNDGFLHAFLHAHPAFPDLLPRRLQARLADYRFYVQALARRGLLSERSRRAGSSVEMWRDVYQSTLGGLACFQCFLRLAPSADYPPVRPIAPMRVVREMERIGRPFGPAGTLMKAGRSGREGIVNVQICSVAPGVPGDQQHISQVVVTFLGQPGTPYMGGRFRLLIRFPKKYPVVPYHACLLTRIFSPFFTSHGDFYFPYTQLEHLRVYDGNHWSCTREVEPLVELVAQYLRLDVGGMPEGEYLPGSVTTGRMVNREVRQVFEKERGLFDQVARRFTHEYAISQY